MQVLSVDFGGKEWVEVSSLRRLPDALADLLPFAVCCQLANVEPVTVGDNDATDWSKSAVDYIITAMDGKLFTAWLEDTLPIGAIVRYSISRMVWCSIQVLLGWFGAHQLGGSRTVLKVRVRSVVLISNNWFWSQSL